MVTTSSFNPLSLLKSQLMGSASVLETQSSSPPDLYSISLTSPEHSGNETIETTIDDLSKALHRVATLATYGKLILTRDHTDLARHTFPPRVGLERAQGP